MANLTNTVASQTSTICPESSLAGTNRGPARSFDDCMSRLDRHETRWAEHMELLKAQADQFKAHFDRTDRQFTTLQRMIHETNQRVTNIEDRNDRQYNGRQFESTDGDDQFPPPRRPPDRGPRRQPGTPGARPTSNVRMDMPRFSGEDPRGWLFKATRYFRCHDYDEEQKILIASVHMDGPALAWVQWLEEAQPPTTWHQFTDELLQQFGPSPYRDLRGELSKLHQTGSVQQFYNEFQSLANQIPGIPAANLQSYFESGLRRDIRREVRAFQPPTMVQALQLARLMEDRLADSDDRPPPRPPRLQASPMPPLLPSPISETRSPAAPAVPFHRLSQAQMADRKSKGLCFNCPEKFVRGHVCKPQAFILIASNDEYDEELSQPVVFEPEPFSPPPDLEVSFQAFTGHVNPTTFRLVGRIGNCELRILLDTGSTHNFLQPKWVRFITQPVLPTSAFDVMVGNGETLPCTGRYEALPLLIQDHQFHVDCYLLPIKGADLVLGVQWMATLGPSTTDFQQMTMSFQLGANTVTLSGLKGIPHAQANPAQLSKLAAQEDSLHCWLQFERVSPMPAADSLEAEWQPIVHQYSHLFQPPTTLPPVRDIDHKIPLQPGTQPVKVRPYRYPHFQKTEIERLVSEMLTSGAIQPSTSAFSSPVLLVKKRDGSWRFCVDYRALNKVTVADAFPMPTMEELIDELFGAVIFTKMDLHSGYHQVRMHPDDIHKTAFRTHDGHYEFTVMPFGLTNAPSTFQSLMNAILRPYLRRFVLVFFDDILIYSRSRELHHQHIRLILDILHQHQLFLKLPKCVFGCAEVTYLGHVVSADGCAVDPDKIRAIQEWPVPQTVRHLRSFLGLAGYYRKFVHHYATLAQPLTHLLGKDKFGWTELANSAFADLKAALTTLPVLAFPDFRSDFILETDASALAIGAVLIQGKRPLAFYSKQLPPLMQRASTYARELYAITESVGKWRQYLLGRRFVIRTDQRSIKELMQQTIQTPEQQRFLLKLLGFRYSIQYNPARTNRVADALSRQVDSDNANANLHNAPALTETPQPSCAILGHSSHSTALLADLQAAQLADPQLRAIRDKLAATPSSSLPHYQLRDNLLLFKQRLPVPADPTLRLAIITECHDTPLCGHGGVKRTLARLAPQFYWRTMRKDVHDFVVSCPTCQVTKPSTQKPAGLLQPLPIPSDIWSDLTMDFIVSLPSSRNKTTIMVVVDRLSKYAHFSALPKHFTAATVAQVFVTDICRLHGIPRSIISDRDTIFLSSFWQELFRLSGTTLKHSSAYHPETDGQTEATNKSVEQYLRSFCMDRPSSWLTFLPWAEFAYNSATHSSTKMTPFEAVYGRLPPPILEYTSEQTTNLAVHELLSQRAAILRTLKENLAEAQNRMKQTADKGRREVQFQPGDKVLVRLQPYRQLSLAAQTYSKLHRRFYGPFRVIKKISEVAYKLALPDASRIHPVFHSSKLKLFRSDLHLHPLELPPNILEGKLVVQPAAVLRQRVVVGRDRDQTQLLVRWNGLPEEDTSWVELEEFRAAYPRFDLEDKVMAEEGRDVMPSRTTYARRHNRDSTNIMNAAIGPKRDQTGQLDREAETVGMGASGGPDVTLGSDSNPIWASGRPSTSGL